MDNPTGTRPQTTGIRFEVRLRDGRTQTLRLTRRSGRTWLVEFTRGGLFWDTPGCVIVPETMLFDLPRLAKACCLDLDLSSSAHAAYLRSLLIAMKEAAVGLLVVKDAQPDGWCRTVAVPVDMKPVV